MRLKDYIGEATAYDKKLMLERKDPTSWLKGNLLEPTPDDSTLKSILKSTLKKTDRTLIEIITRMPSATIAEMQDQLGITRDGVNKAIKRLKAAGVIRRIGPDKGGHWEVVK